MKIRYFSKQMNRGLAGAVMIAVVFVLLFSVMFLSGHVHHHCEDEDCPICMVMAQCSDNIKTLSAAIAFICCGLLLIAPILNIRAVSGSDSVTNSLVFQKVRMNN